MYSFAVQEVQEPGRVENRRDGTLSGARRDHWRHSTPVETPSCRSRSLRRRQRRRCMHSGRKATSFKGGGHVQPRARLRATRARVAPKSIFDLEQTTLFSGAEAVSRPYAYAAHRCDTDTSMLGPLLSRTAQAKGPRIGATFAQTASLWLGPTDPRRHLPHSTRALREAGQCR